MSITDKSARLSRLKKKGDLKKKLKTIVKRVDVYDVLIALGIVPKEDGSNIGAPCPFHSDKDPSFYVKAEGRTKGLYQCFGCEKKGDLVGLVMELQDLRFPDAVVWLQGYAKGGSGVVTRIVREIVEGMNGNGQVELPVGEVHRGEFDAIFEWLMGRRLADGETCAFRPESIEFVVESFGLRMGVDNYTNRVIVPVYDSDEELVGYEAIAVRRDDDTVRKVLYMEGPGWVKSNVLHQCAIGTFGRGPVLILEGAVDLMRVVSMGYGGISVGGTKFHPTQAEKVLMLAGGRGIVVVADNDADDKDKKKGLRLVSECKSRLGDYLNVKVATLPEGTDPADCTERELARAIRKAK